MTRAWSRALLAGLGLAWLLLASPVVAAAGGACRLAWGLALEGQPVTAAQIAQGGRETGLAPRLVVFFLQWPAPGQTGEFPRASLEAIVQAGATPCLTWEPMHLDQQGQEVMAREEDILGGAYDAYLRAFARAARTWGRPLIVRLGHEMNLARYHWGGDPADYGPDSPARYQRLYRHVVEVCRSEGAGNLLWAFCPNAESNPHPQWHGAAWNTATAYYPGDAYVDLLGMDGYNWGRSQTMAAQGWDSRWQEFAELFGGLRAELRALAPDKPLLVFETSCSRAGGDRAAWARGAARTARQWGLGGLVWFQADKEVDWRLLADRDAAAIAALAGALDCPPQAAPAWLQRPAKTRR